MSCFLTSLRVTNSSKYIRIRFPVKLVVPEGGVIFNTLGGVISLSPPVGVPIRAHCHKKIVKESIFINFIIFFIIIYYFNIC